MSSIPSLFDADLISSTLQALLPPNLRLRPLANGDYRKQFTTLLAQLTVIGDDYNEEAWETRFKYMLDHNDSYFVVVIEDNQTTRVIATGTM